MKETEHRRNNADYLTNNLKEISGISPVRLPDNSRAVWHLYPMRYDSARFAGLTRGAFMQALRAEGVPCSGVYREQYYDGSLDEAINSRGFRRLFSKQRLSDYRDSFHSLKGNKEVCSTTVAIPQTLLLGKRREMDQIIDAVTKIQSHSAELARRAS